MIKVDTRTGEYLERAKGVNRRDSWAGNRPNGSQA